MAQRIYREGVLPSGEPLRGAHPGGVVVSGAFAACVLCHRRSGLGTVEGTRIILPITGRFLYQPRPTAGGPMDLHRARGPDFAHALGRNRLHDPYTDQTLVRAIREGTDSSGVTLDGMMPRYALSDSDAQLLVDYLKQLSKQWSPGVTEDSIRFATVMTPDVDPAKRKAMLDVLHTFFDIKNRGTRLDKLREQPYPGSQYKTYRSWDLQVWDLSGPPETWEAQLADHYQRQPVFALISGLSQGDWAPVHEFCEKQGIPCWFPTVDLPVVAPADYYPVYFSEGVILEAHILAHQLSERGEHAGVKRVVQIRGDDPAAAGAAQALEKALRKSGHPARRTGSAHGRRGRAAASYRRCGKWRRPGILAARGRCGEAGGGAGRGRGGLFLGDPRRRRAGTGPTCLEGAGADGVSVRASGQAAREHGLYVHFHLVQETEFATGR